MNREQVAASLNGLQKDSLATAMEGLQDVIVVYCTDEEHIHFKGTTVESLIGYDDAQFVLFRTATGISVANQDSVIIDAAKNKDTAKLEAQEQQQEVTIVRNPEEPVLLSWLITATVPHAAFDILEGERLLCRGVVIDSAAIH